MVKINSIGDHCPIPVIKARKALKEIDNGTVMISVDNRIATENLEKMADEMKCKIYIKEISKEHYDVSITKGEGDFSSINEPTITSENIVVISSKYMGVGDEKLGTSLMKSYIYALTELDILPEKIIFYNSGAFLTTEGSDCITDLEKLNKLGVKILTCGACLNFYKLDGKLLVGQSTNMYVIAETLLQCKKIIKP